MAEGRDGDPGSAGNRTLVERLSERELVVTRIFDAPARTVFEAWTEPELLKLWWAPRSAGLSLVACEADVRAGGTYRFAFGDDASTGTVFFGRYLDVIPGARLVWTNEETDAGAVTTVTFEDRDGGTLLVFRELYPTTDARDQAFAGMQGGVPEQFEQLDEFLVGPVGRVGRP